MKTYVLQSLDCLQALTLDHDFSFQTVDEIYKVASISLSPNVPGQIFVSENV